MLNDVTVFNIREYLSAKGDKDLGEDELRQLLSEFFCDKNPDVERFLYAFVIHRYLVCRLKRLEVCDFSHVRFSYTSNIIWIKL